VPGIGLGVPEHGVGAVETVQNAQHPEAIVELEVVKVMRLGAGKEGQVVAGMGVQRGEDGEGVPGSLRDLL
jgi:hypothetical protein